MQMVKRLFASLLLLMMVFAGTACEMQEEPIGDEGSVGVEEEEVEE